MQLRRLLMPVAALYAVGQRIDMARKIRERYHSALPVISVGNLSTGGTGKTPLALRLIERLNGEHELLVLSRGYGRVGSGDHLWRAGEALPGPALFGDEPALMARLLNHGALGVSSDRAGFLRNIESDFSRSVVLLDDGFQHYGLARDLDLVIVDERTARDPFPLPAGVLREPPGALGRAHLLLATSDAAYDLASRWKNERAEIFRMRQESGGITRWGDNQPYAGEPGIAVSGIARPERFFDSLRAADAVVLFRSVYGDHHRYSRADLGRILEAMKNAGAKVVLTTAKDAVKLAEYPELRDVLFVMHLRVAIEGEERLLALVRERITNKNKQQQ